jgi:hypothetical protein
MTAEILPILGVPQRYAALLDLPDEPEDEAAVMALVQEVSETNPEGEQRWHLLTLAKVIQQLEAEAADLAARAAAIQQRANMRARRAEAMRSWLQNSMEQWGIDKVKDTLVTVYLQRSNPSVQVLDVDAVPGAYKRGTLVLPWGEVPEELRERVAMVAVLKQAILAAVKETGEVVPGVRIETDKKHVRIQ